MKLYYSSQFAPLVVFFLLFLSVVKNNKLPHFVRFNCMQGIMIDIVVMLFNILRAYFPAELRWSAVLQVPPARPFKSSGALCLCHLPLRGGGLISASLLCRRCLTNSAGCSACRRLCTASTGLSCAHEALGASAFASLTLWPLSASIQFALLLIARRFVCRGKYADIPYVSESVYMQVEASDYA